jgi:hypothetical protein
LALNTSDGDTTVVRVQTSDHCRMSAAGAVTSVAHLA